MTRYFRAYSAYASSAAGPPVYFGGVGAPLPVAGGGPVGGPAFLPSQGSGTGAPGEGLSGPGPVPFRSTTGAPPVRGRSDKASGTGGTPMVGPATASGLPTAASAPSAGGGAVTVPATYGLHAGRTVPLAASSPNAFYIETDRGEALYQSQAGSWVFLQGVYRAALANQPADLGAGDAGFVFVDTTPGFTYLWTGAAWAVVEPFTDKATIYGTMADVAGVHELEFVSPSGTAISRVGKAQDNNSLVITVNARYDGAAWQRDDITKDSCGASFSSAGGVYLFVASAGANPITWIQALQIGLTGNVGFQKIFSAYNNIVTQGQGVPPIYAFVPLLNQAGAISTDLKVGGAMAPAGFYRVGVSASTSGFTGVVTGTLTWTDLRGARSVPLILWTNPISGIVYATSEIYTGGGAQINFSTTVAGTPNYDLWLTLERLS